MCIITFFFHTHLWPWLWFNINWEQEYSWWWWDPVKLKVDWLASYFSLTTTVSWIVVINIEIKEHVWKFAKNQIAEDLFNTISTETNNWEHLQFVHSRNSQMYFICTCRDTSTAYFDTPGITRFHQQQWIWKLSAPFSVTFYQDSVETNWELGGDRKLVLTVLSGRCYIYADDATNWSATEIQHHRHKYYPVRHVCLWCVDAAYFCRQIWLHIMGSNHFQNHKSRGVLELIKMSWSVSGSEGMRVARECRRAKFASRLVRRALMPPLCPSQSRNDLVLHRRSGPSYVSFVCPALRRPTTEHKETSQYHFHVCVTVSMINSLVPRRSGCDLKNAIFNHYWLVSSDLMSLDECHWTLLMIIQVSIGSCNGLVPSGYKPLTEPTLPRSKSSYGVTRPRWVKHIHQNNTVTKGQQSML